MVRIMKAIIPNFSYRVIISFLAILLLVFSIISYSSYSNNNYSAMADTVAGVIPLGSAPRGIAYNPSNGFMYVARAPDIVTVIGGINIIADIKIGLTSPTGIDRETYPYDIAYNPSNGFMYVVDSMSHTWPPATNGYVTVIKDTAVISHITKRHDVCISSSF
jgi:DNA-binding beta-propeller fold protein YncE